MDYRDLDDEPDPQLCSCPGECRCANRDFERPESGEVLATGCVFFVVFWVVTILVWDAMRG